MKKLLVSLLMCLPIHATLVVIIPSYNNTQWYEQNLGSVLAQTHDDWRGIYIDDCSPDGTGQAVAEYLASHDNEGRFTLVRNEQRRGALANLYDAIHSCDDSDVIVTLDGDDWFADEHVLAHCAHMYADKAVWMTYGVYREYPSGNLGSWQKVPANIIAENSFRQHPWITSHLRTFYVGLFKAISRDDLLYEDEFFTKTWDMAFMFPMLEMAGEHARNAERVLYSYNLDNPLNDWKEDLQLMLHLEKVIRSKKCYKRLEEPMW